MRTYHQLTTEQRYQIWVLKKTGSTQTEIVKEVGVHKSTISREVRRNQGKAAIVPSKPTKKQWFGGLKKSTLGLAQRLGRKRKKS